MQAKPSREWCWRCPPGQGLLRTGRAPSVWRRRCPGDPRWCLCPAPVPCPQQALCVVRCRLWSLHTVHTEPRSGHAHAHHRCPRDSRLSPRHITPRVKGGLGSSWLMEWVATVMLHPANLGDPCFGPGSSLGWGPPGDTGEKKAGTVSCSKLPGGPSGLPGRGLLRQQWRGRGRTPGLRNAAQEPQVAARFPSAGRERPLSPPSPSARLHFLIVPLFWCGPPSPALSRLPAGPHGTGGLGALHPGICMNSFFQLGGAPWGTTPSALLASRSQGPTSRTVHSRCLLSAEGMEV